MKYTFDSLQQQMSKPASQIERHERRRGRKLGAYCIGAGVIVLGACSGQLEVMGGSGGNSNTGGTPGAGTAQGGLSGSGRSTGGMGANGGGAIDTGAGGSDEGGESAGGSGGTGGSGAPVTCDDGELNGDETDVDCGGSCLAPCPCDCASSDSLLLIGCVLPNSRDVPRASGDGHAVAFDVCSENSCEPFYFDVASGTTPIPGRVAAPA